MKFQKRSSVYTNLNQYCCLARSDAIIEVSEWSNGLGWDVALDQRRMAITRGELQALQVLCNIQHQKD